MSKTLNQYASRVAHIVGQPDNHSMKERIKEMIKDYFAKYIIQSIDKNGIQGYYKIPLLITLTPVEETAVINTLYNIKGHLVNGKFVHSIEDDTDPDAITHPLYKRYVDFVSTTKIPTPMNIKNDSPFTKVSIANTSKLFSYCSKVMFRMSYTLAPTRCSRLYTYDNNTITVKRIMNYDNIYSTEIIDEIEVEGIWENPEEVIGYYGISDNQDLELPFPNEMLNFIIAELLKVEFGILPKDIEVTKE